MNQIKFLWISNNIPNKLGVEQTEDGIVIVKLRPKIDITHNYKKRDRMEIIFKDDNKRYLIHDHKILKEIYTLHMQNEEVMLLLHQYCESNLTLINEEN